MHPSFHFVCVEIFHLKDAEKTTTPIFKLQIIMDVNNVNKILLIQVGIDTLKPILNRVKVSIP